MNLSKLKVGQTITLGKTGRGGPSFDDEPNGNVKLFSALVLADPCLSYIAKDPIPNCPSSMASSQNIKLFGAKYIKPLENALAKVAKAYAKKLETEDTPAPDIKEIVSAAISYSCESSNFHAYSEWNNVYWVSFLNGELFSPRNLDFDFAKKDPEVKACIAATKKAIAALLVSMTPIANKDPIKDYDDR